MCIDFEKDLRRIVESRQKAISQPEQTLFETFVSVLLASIKCHYSFYWLTVQIGLDGGWLLVELQSDNSKISLHHGIIDCKGTETFANE